MGQYMAPTRPNTVWSKRLFPEDLRITWEHAVGDSHKIRVLSGCSASRAVPLASTVAIGRNAIAAGAPFYQGRTYTGAIYLFVRQSICSFAQQPAGVTCRRLSSGLLRM
jgi:hypothetical protein